MRAMAVGACHLDFAAMPAQQIDNDFKPQTGAVGSPETAHMRHQQRAAAAIGQAGTGVRHIKRARGRITARLIGDALLGLLTLH